jgi:hypothetical protein
MRRGDARLPASEVQAQATVTLRFAVVDDAPDLWRLAQVDSAEPLAEPILIALVSGQLRAAVSLENDRVLADPFVLTSGEVELLRARARQLTGPGRRWGRRPRGARRLQGLLRTSAL